ncbi:MAG: LD-carboxypeptidase [Gemmatimonadaceae bacterium]
MHADPARPLRTPPRLGPGARVALIAPAGPLRDATELARAGDNARAFGWEPFIGSHALARRGYLAGSDAERARDLNAALADRSIDGVWCLRGGYGTMRILHALDVGALARRPKVVIGYSDITALHLAIAARCGIISYHGPTARANLSAFTRRSLARAVCSNRGEGVAADPCGAAPGARTLRAGRARGVLAGGNLALVAALVGTPDAARLDGALLVLEDVNEPVYRIDRMLRQLRLSGSLAGVRGIIFGAFTERGADDEPPAALPLDEVLAETADALRVPCIAGAPIGHIDDQWTLPLGAEAELDADACYLAVLATAPASPAA